MFLLFQDFIATFTLKRQDFYFNFALLTDVCKGN